MISASIFRDASRLVLMLAISAALGACGSGGDDVDDDGGDVDITDEPAPPLPALVKFGIGTKDGAPLTFTANLDTTAVVIAYPLLGFGGTWDRNAGAYSLTGGTSVSTTPSPPLFGGFSNQIVDPLAWVGYNPPSAGKLEQITPAGNPFFLPDPVQATFGSVGVRLTYPSETPLDVDWDTYVNLWLDDTQIDAWRLASFGGATMSLAIERVRMILDLMAFINANDMAISAAGSTGLVTACSPRPGAATGTRRIALANPDGEFNPGDDLVVTYENCWIDDPTDDIDQLLDGSITLSGYIENVTDAGDFVSTGFDEFRFDSLKVRETETVGSVVNVDPASVVTTGTLTLFVQP